MAGNTFMGIPRELIPWAPSIDPDLCVGCGECLAMCANDVYVLNEAEGRMEVAAPQNCVVLCDKCAALCPNEAITFPDKQQTKALLAQLLRASRSTSKQGESITGP